MAIILGSTVDTADRFKFALGEDATLVESIAQLEEALSRDLNEQLVIVGPDVDLAIATNFAERYRVPRPALGVILTRRRVDLTVMGQALRFGVREVVNIDDAAALVTACQRSLALSMQFVGVSSHEASPSRGKAVLVFSAKGGCGKTTISTNLAQALSEMGSVCLVDFDLQFGDVGVALRINPTKTVANAIAMGDHLDRQAVSSLVINYKPNFDVLLAPPNPVDAEYMTGDIGRAILNELVKMYEYVVIDSSPAFTDVVLEAFDAADFHFIITTLDIPTLKNLRVSTATLDELEVPRTKRHVLVNYADQNTGLSVEDVERAIDGHVAVRIPYSADVPMAVNRGVTMVESDPRHPVSRAIYEIAAMVAGKAVTQTSGRRDRKERRGK